jgi:preprotein translocase SecF subunit
MAVNEKMIDKELQAVPGMKRAVAEEKAASKAMEVLTVRMAKILKEKFPQANFEQKQTYHVGGTVGAQFKKYAILSLALSSLAIILYLAFRFEFAYGVAAVIALIHDVIVAAGVGALMDKQLSLTVLAALLTIIGYSVNDTIVVFDRIRESFSLQRKGSYEEVVNLSINQTLSRTLLTSVTVFFCVLSLYLLGGGAINDFALIMLVGVVVGTYSSVFVASAIVVSWHKRRPLNAAVPVKAVEEDVVEEA